MDSCGIFQCYQRYNRPLRSGQIAPKEVTPTSREQPNSTQLTHEDVLGWKKCLNQLLNDPNGREIFRAFLKKEFCDENLLFWLACQDLNQSNLEGEELEDQVRLIYEDFISALSPKEISLDGKLRALVNEKIVQPGRETFIEAQAAIFTLMERDPYHRFIMSSVYVECLKQAEQNINKSK